MQTVGLCCVVRLRVIDLPETAPGATRDQPYDAVSLDEIREEMAYASSMGVTAYLRQAIAYTNTLQ